MAQSINTNTSALNTQHYLYNAQLAQTSAMQRLSSGLRINSAKDDAAGLSIAERMTAQIRGLDQSARNTNDGISITQVADGGLSKIGDTLQRMREIAVQAANDSNSSADRASLQNDFMSLYNEIDRISETTGYNGIKLLSTTGANLGRNIQVGGFADQNISFIIGQTDTKSLGLNSPVPFEQTYTGRVKNQLVTAGGLVVNGIPIAAAVLAGAFGANIAGQEASINSISTSTGVTADAFNKVTGSQATVDSTHVVSGLTVSVAATNGAAGAVVTIDPADNLQQVMENINRQVNDINASIGANGNLILTNQDGATITIGGTTSFTGLTAGSYHGFVGMNSKDGSDIQFSMPGVGYLASGNSTMVGFGIKQGGATATIAGALTALDLLMGTYDVSANATDVVKINGVTVGPSLTGSATDKAAAINAIGAEAHVTAIAQTVAYVSIDGSKLGAANSFSLNGSVITLAPTDLGLNDVITKINAAGISGIRASADSASGMLKLSSDSGIDIFVGDEDATGATGGQLVTAVRDRSPTFTPLAIVAGGVAGIRGRTTVISTDGSSLSIEGNGTATGGTGLNKLGLIDFNTNEVVINSNLNVTTASSANAAISLIDNAINIIATKRQTLASVQNRFESAMSTSTLTSENMTAARSRIQDADIAHESAELSRSQILQQSGTAMLAQANQSNDRVLSLLMAAPVWFSQA